MNIPRHPICCTICGEVTDRDSAYCRSCSIAAAMFRRAVAVSEFEAAKKRGEEREVASCP